MRCGRAVQAAHPSAPTSARQRWRRSPSAPIGLPLSGCRNMRGGGTTDRYAHPGALDLTCHRQNAHLYALPTSATWEDVPMPAQTYLFPCLQDNYGVLLHDAAT